MTPTRALRSALLICEGSSDLPLGNLVRTSFLDRGVPLRVTAPDFSLLPDHVGHETERKVQAGIRLFDAVPDVLIVHRDADAAGADARRTELASAREAADIDCPFVPVVPVAMTEAWLLLDAKAIRTVAGNPSGRVRLDLPRVGQVEAVADPEHLPGQCLLTAADLTGRRRDKVAKRFPAHRRQLLERLDRSGPLTELPSYRALVRDVDAAVKIMMARSS